jgi:hypothetical protein
VGYGAVGTDVHALDACPGGARVAVAVQEPDDPVVVVDVATLAPVDGPRERRGGAFSTVAAGIACRDERADDVDVLVRDDAGEVPVWSVVGRTPAETLFLGPAAAAALDPRAARVVAVHDGAVVAVDVGPGVTRARVDEGIELARLDGGREVLDVDVDGGGRVAVLLGATVEWHHRADEVVLLDRDGAEVVRTPLGPERWTTGARFLADGRLAIPPYPRSGPAATPTELLVVDRGGGLTGVVLPGVPTSAVGVDGGLLATTDVGLVHVDTAGAAAVVGSAEATAWSITSLDEPTVLDAPAPAPVSGVLLPASADADQTGVEEVGDRGVPGISAIGTTKAGGGSDAGPWALGSLVAPVGLVVAALTVAGRRRRRPGT